MSEETKKTRARSIPETSQAPDPPSPIRSHAPPPKKSKPADYQHWNRFLLLTFGQCLMLLLGIEPGTKIQESSVREKYDRLWELINSCRKAGTLQYAGRQPDQIQPSKFIEWAISNDLPVPKEWKPAVSVVNPAKKHRQKKSKELQDSCVTELREAAVKLCVKKARQSIEDKYITVEKISVELYKDGKFENGDPFSGQWQRPETMRGHLKGKNNPKRDDRYRRAKPDKPYPFN